MKLSLQQIQFIDNYLKKAEVVYIDIRSEMIDHIATAVEEKMDNESLDFYEAFKQYMVVNKKELLKNKGSWSIYSKAVIVAFLNYAVHPLRLIIAVSLFLFFNSINVNAYLSEDFTFRNLFFIIVLVTALGQMIYFHFVLKQRFFVLERLGGLLALLYYLQIFFMNINIKEPVGVYTLTGLYYLLAVYLLYFTKEVIKFQKNKNRFI